LYFFYFYFYFSHLILQMVDHFQLQRVHNLHHYHILFLLLFLFLSILIYFSTLLPSIAFASSFCFRSFHFIYILRISVIFTSSFYSFHFLRLIEHPLDP
jgi:hypothetical protein